MIYRSTYKESLGEFLSHSLTEHEKNIFEMLFNGYGMQQKLQSAFFELCRVGDGKYTLIVQKYVNGTWSAKFFINKKYGNASERFSM